MIHFYTAKTWRGSDEKRVKLLCTQDYVDFVRHVHITVPTNVTCGNCLRVLIPIQEQRLRTMNGNLARAQERESADS